MKNNKHNNTESQKGNYEKSLNDAINYLDDYIVSHEPDSEHYDEFSQLHLWLFELRELRNEREQIKGLFQQPVDFSSCSPEVERLCKIKERNRKKMDEYIESLKERKAKENKRTRNIT